jgi:Ca2+-binding EF-hand superfamily protein
VCDELLQLIGLLGNQTTTPFEVKEMIDAVDANGDGKIDFQEFKVLMGSGSLAETPTFHNRKSPEVDE